VIVVDFGTATNMEVVDADGRFIGGVIAPGVETSASALFSHATKLGAIDLVDPHTAIGHNTEEAIQAGIVYGEADRVDGIIRRIFAQLGYETPVVATGGLASRVAAQSQTITAINPELTLEGLRLVYEAQEGAASV
jgi:type III pantothenate kinase